MLVVLVLVLPILLVSELSIRQSEQRYDAGLRQTTLEAAQAIGRDVSLRIDVLRVSVAAAANNALLKDAVRARDLDRIESFAIFTMEPFLRSQGGIRVLVADSAGLVLHPRSLFGIVISPTVRIEGTSFFRAAQAAGTRLASIRAASVSVIDPEEFQGARRIFLSAPLPHGLDPFVGAVILEVRPSDLGADLRAESARDVYLIDRRGRVVTRAADPSDREHDVSTTPTVSEAMAGTYGVKRGPDLLGGTASLLASAPVGDIGWSVVVARAPDAADAELAQGHAQQRSLALALAAVLLLGTLAWGRATSRSLRRRDALAEALEQQTATAEILRTIGRTPLHLQPVLDTLIDNAVRLCDADNGSIFRLEGEGAFRHVAAAGRFLDAEAFRQYYRDHVRRTDRGSVTGRVLLERRTIQIDDVASDPEYDRVNLAIPAGGTRTILGVPLLRENEPVGVMVLRRMQVRPFSHRQRELSETFAAQAVIAIENVRLFNETKEGLQRQTAIGEILSVISTSPADIQPVLDTIAESATRFCGAEDASVLLLSGGALVPTAHHGPIEMQMGERIAVDRTTVSGRALLEQRTVHVEDVTADDEFPGSRRFAELDGQRTVLASPLVRGGKAIGVIALRRGEPRAFSEQQVRLVETFADQAVIAIENVRLFNETKEALEQQTATAELLKVISTSNFELAPVFDAVAQNAVELCGADNASIIYWRDEGAYRYIANAGTFPDQQEFTAQWEGFKVQPGRGTLTGRVLLERSPVQIEDIDTDPEYEHAGEKASGTKTHLAVPLLKDGEPIGAIIARRFAARLFTEQQVRLLETFAAQAVIAIENTRLFNQTNDALARQTAVSEVLGTISRSVFDIEAILTTVIQNAVRLCGAKGGLIFRRDGEAYRLAAVHGGHPAFVEYFKDRVLHPGRQAVTMRAVTVGEPVQIEDVLEDPEYEHTEVRKFEPFRTVLGIPLLHQSKPIGAMSLWRNEVKPFSANEVDLVRTFADQAAIAIENVRLFNETKEALEQQTAISEVLATISRSVFDLQPVLDTVIENAARLCEADAAWMSKVEGDRILLPGLAVFGTDANGVPIPLALDDRGTRMVAALPDTIMGRPVVLRRPVSSPDVTSDPELTRSTYALRIGARSVLAVPMLRDGQPIGVVVVARHQVRPFTGREIQLVQTFADQAAIAIENVRLFNEIQDKSRQLEVASRHKSEFLANMSHELRTPLNAIIGFTDVMLQELFGPLNEKQKEYLDDVRGSGNHLLTLINDILDLSKIEAGRIELDLAEFSFPEALENALTLVRERAARHGITIAPEVAADVATITADERKLKQILVNLLSNAVKFTPDGGWVGISVSRADGEVVVAVRDTGIGIAPEDHERVFEEFQQVGRGPERAREGTGLGLTLSKRFVELHGGRIWVESELGKGSTFTFAVPVRQTALAKDAHAKAPS